MIEGTAVRLDETAVETLTVETQPGWEGDSPFFLVIETDSATGNVGIDLDEPGWIEKHKELMRSPGTWWLHHKASGRPIVCLVLEEGEQGYFVKHHVGNLMAGSEIMAVGIGKKVPARWHMTKGRKPKRVVTQTERYERLWLLPNGVICGGDDVDTIASRMLEGR